MLKIEPPNIDELGPEARSLIKAALSQSRIVWEPEWVEEGSGIWVSNCCGWKIVVLQSKCGWSAIRYQFLGEFPDEEAIGIDINNKGLPTLEAAKSAAVEWVNNKLNKNLNQRGGVMRDAFIKVMDALSGLNWEDQRTILESTKVLYRPV